MTEKEIYDLQRDIYWYLSNRFQQENIPPIIQKLIIEGIYCKIQMLAESYDWNLFIEKRITNPTAMKPTVIQTKECIFTPPFK